MTLKTKEVWLSVQYKRREKSPSAVRRNLFYPRLLSLICLLSWIYLQHTSHLLTDLISSVSQPASFSHTASAAGCGRSRWVSLDVTQKHRGGHSIDFHEFPERQPRAPSLTLTCAILHLHRCEKKSVQSALALFHCCAAKPKVHCQWWDLSGLNITALYSHTHTQSESAHSFSEEQNATLKLIQSFQ